MRYEYRFALASLLAGLSFFSLVLAIPLLSKEMGLSLTENGWLLGIFSVAVILFSPIWGALSDRLGKRKPFLTIGTMIFALAVFLQFLPEAGFRELLVLRFIQGAAFATNPMLTALFSDHFGARATHGFGFFSAANALGWGLGSLLGGVFAEWLGIRWAFVLSAGVALAGALVIQFALPEAPPAHRAAARAPLPPGFNYLYATIFIRHTAAMALWSVFPIYLTNFIQNKALIGAVNSVNMYVQPLFMVLMGRWGQRYEKLGLVRWGIIGSVITFGVYASAPNIWQIVLAQVMIAIAWSAIFIGLNLYLIERTSENARGRAFGLLQASLTTAAAAGPFVGGPLSDYWGMQSMIWIVAAMMALSLPFLWRLRVLDRARARLSPRQDSI